jgi:cell division protein FtsQ
MKLYTPKKRKKKAARRILAIAVLFLIVFAVFKLITYSFNKFNNWSFLQIKNIEVLCSPPLKNNEITVLSDIKKGTNIFTTKLSDAKEKIRTNPWVKRVKIKRSLPDTIKINVINKNVRLMSRKDNVVYYIDDNGVIIDKLLPGLSFDVPIVETKGLNYLDAIDIINRINKSGWINEHDISEIFVSRDFITLYLIDEDIQINLNTSNLEQSVVNAKKVMADLEEKGERASLIDASISDNRIFVRNLRKK